MKFLQIPIVASLCSLLVIIPMTGCTVTQSKINTVVQDIATYAPIISADAANLANAATAFDPNDALLIQQSLTTLQNDSAALTALCNQYLAAPSSSLLTQITATVSELATTDSDALLKVLQIKNPQSLATSKLILASIATGITILSVYLSSINQTVSPAAATSLTNLKPYVQQNMLIDQLDKVKSQNLVPQNTTLQSFGF